MDSDDVNEDDEDFEDEDIDFNAFNITHFEDSKNSKIIKVNN